ncbi:hypothetical protein DASC09_025150 [Saccharomycopsis crataegensis]|uniref:BZIP domain-containing protein n=1 Tax=Saccharomycopsis crataegensis TaxID=43959 RepID=A0AAV5QKZ0_9ASCO|nr:hypothetical protein DASC09_025150 [Saccharomycopsis crataegensis]
MSNSSKKAKVKLTIKLDNNKPAKGGPEWLSSPVLPASSTDKLPSPADEFPLETPTNGTFTSTLPPRKRARTKEEKEQRRIERILRNRRAAHLSREKKKKYIELLENGIIGLVAGVRECQKTFFDSNAVLSGTSDPETKLREISTMISTISTRFTEDESWALNNQCLDEILEKIHQNKNLTMQVKNDDSGETNSGSVPSANSKAITTPVIDAISTFSTSNPTTPTSAISLHHSVLNGPLSQPHPAQRGLNGHRGGPTVVTHTINTYLKTQKHYSNPSTPRSAVHEAFGDAESDAEAAESLQRLANTPVSVKHSVNGHSIAHNPISTALASAPTSVPSSSSVPPLNGLGIAFNGNANGQLLNMNPNVDFAKTESTPIEVDTTDDEEEENDAIRIMMSLRNGNGK